MPGRASDSAVNRPLNFLQVTTFYPPYSFGGDAVHIHRLSHALGDAGHHVDVIHTIDAYHLLHPAKPEIEFGGHPNVVTYGLRGRPVWLSPLLAHQTGRPYARRGLIREILNAKRYDVIHFHNISLLGPEVLAIEPIHDRALKVYTAHEHWLICPTHVLWKLNSRPCELPRCLWCTVMAKRPPQIWRHTGLLRESSKHVDRFFSPSGFSAEMHAARGFPRPMEVLPYFIERVDDDWRHPGPRPQDQPYFLFVGRLEVIKGMQSLIALWQKGMDFDLLVAGTGSYEKQLRAQAGTTRSIKFLGPRSQRELGALYYHALACIVPSQTFETFGIVAIESFARKTPVIARDLGALPEVVHQSGGGLVYRDDEELRAAMQRIASSPEVRRELGERGYQSFVQRWSREAHLERYFDSLRCAAIEKLGCVPWESQSPGAS